MKTLKIGNKSIGQGFPVFFIAEAGVNHNGSLKLALKMVDVAKKAGADAIKFQTYSTSGVYVKDAGKSDYLVYFKNQLLRNRTLYTKKFYGGRIYTDYYFEKYGIIY